MSARWNSRTAIIAMPLAALGLGWIWHALSEPVYEAEARIEISLASTTSEISEGETGAPVGLEATVLAPEVIEQTISLLHERRVPIATESVFVDEGDELLKRTGVSQDLNGRGDVARLTYRTSDPEIAVPVLTAIIETCVAVNGPPKPSDDQSVRERERQQLADAVEEQREIVARLEQEVLGATAEVASQALVVEKMKTLGNALATARQARIEAENRLAQVRQDLEGGTPVELLAARLPDGELKDAAQTLLGRSTAREQLRQAESARQAVAAVYGRNHPRMAELRQQIAELTTQLGAEDSTHSDERDVSRSEQLIAALEGDWNQARVSEQDLQDQLAAEIEQSHVHEQIVAELNAARAELDFLQSDHNRLDRQLAAAERDADQHRARIIEPATLAADPVSLPLWQRLLYTGAGGLGVSVLLVWRGRRATRAARPAPVPAVPPARERFKSQEEQQLARLKMLSTRSAA